MGVDVQTLSPGNGEDYPKQGDFLCMHYTGSLKSNGDVFDSSVTKGRPFHFRIGVGQVIQGWDQGVIKMSLGEKAKLDISSDFGYGARGAGGVIPPNADLIFEVELLSINGKGVKNGDLRMCNKCATFETQPGQMNRCSSCKTAHYCNRDCQTADWPTHKQYCGRA